jgi:hypothetical protein
MVEDFKTFMVAAGSLSHFSAVKTRHKLAIQKAQFLVVPEEEKQRHQAFIEQVLMRFDHFVSSGNSFRKAFISVRDDLTSYHLSSYQVELICRAAGRLSRRNQKKAF